VFKAQIVFKDEAGQVVSIDRLSPNEFYSGWAAGKLRRGVEVTAPDWGVIKQGLENPQSPQFQIVCGEVYSTWSELDSQLALPWRLLTLSDVQLDAGQVDRGQAFDSSREVTFAQELDWVEIRSTEKYHNHFYWLSAVISHEADWYRRDPKEVVHDMIMELLQQWTVRDNATLLHLLNTSADAINNTYTFDSFTPIIFNSMKIEIAKWHIESPHCLATARVMASSDFSAWDRFADYTHADLNPVVLEDARLMEAYLYCLGSPHDDFYPLAEGWNELFLCGSPQDLGVRTVGIEPKAEIVKETGQHGWLWSTYIGTAVTNARAVVAGQLYEDK
jgi:hypothetical protein